VSDGVNTTNFAGKKGAGVVMRSGYKKYSMLAILTGQSITTFRCGEIVRAFAFVK